MRQWALVEPEYLMILQSSSSLTYGFTCTETWLTASLCFHQGERGVPGLPGDHGEKGEPGDSVIGPPVSMMYWSVCVPTLIIQLKPWYLQLKEWDPLWITRSMLIKWTLSWNCSSLLWRAGLLLSGFIILYVPPTASLNLADLIVSESAFIFEIQDCWRQRINRAKGV